MKLSVAIYMQFVNKPSDLQQLKTNVKDGNLQCMGLEPQLNEQAAKNAVFCFLNFYFRCQYWMLCYFEVFREDCRYTSLLFFLSCKNCWEWLNRPDSTADKKKKQVQNVSIQNYIVHDKVKQSVCLQKSLFQFSSTN